jgi:hypothetical protein
MSDPVYEASCAAIGDILERLAIFAMDAQILAPALMPLIETALVHAAEQEVQRVGSARPDISTVSARTGFSRRRVRRIRKYLVAQSPSASTRPPQLLRVLQAWKTDPDFLDVDDEPRVLTQRGHLSFTTLAEREGTGVRAAAILKELLRIKAVRMTPERRVELLNRPDIDAERRAQAIKDLGKSASELIDTLAYNAANPDTPRYHRRVVGHVNTDDVPRLTRDAAAQAGVWAVALEDAINHKDVMVRAGPTPKAATELTGQFFISERPSIVAASREPHSARKKNKSTRNLNRSGRNMSKKEAKTRNR